MRRESVMAVVRASCMVACPHSFMLARVVVRLFSASLTPIDANDSEIDAKAPGIDAKAPRIDAKAPRIDAN